ncbi:MAG: efflux RND transporter periplasmic adaptor subunit, partial [Candidatus Saccharibacteria bacterium]
RFFTKKRIIWGTVILVVLLMKGWRVFGSKKTPGSNLTENAKRQDIKQTVLATGQVTSTTDLSLSFRANGVVKQIKVNTNDTVKSGDILATLDQKDQLAALTSARGTLAQFNANYQRVLDGASSEEVMVAQRAVDSAQVSLTNAKQSLEDVKNQQKVAVENAHRALLSSGVAAVPASYNSGNVTASISGTYNSTEEGTYNLSLYDSGLGRRFKISGLETAEGFVNATGPVPFGTRGLYLQFSSVPTSVTDTWTVEIPNTKSVSYILNKNAYDAAVQGQQTAINGAEAAVNSAQASYDQAMASLNLKKAQAKPADLQYARAQVLSAQGQYEAASASLENTVIRAPADGTITSIDVKVGEIATAQKPVMVLQDVDKLHVEANISEANISELKVDQPVDLTFDAFSADKHFTAKVTQIDPASTVISGVVNYKVTVSLDKIEGIKPGMTANLTVLTAEKKDVLAIPSRAIIQKDDKKFVRIVNDPKKKTYDEKEVTVGINGDGGLIEILSGLESGQEIVTFIKK